MKELIEKYRDQYEPWMGNFLFRFEEITFEIMVDFTSWKTESYETDEENIVIFYQEV